MPRCEHYHTKLLTATDGELADALGQADAELTAASDRMDQIERELKRRGCNRAAGTRYAVIAGDGGLFVMDMTAIADAVAGFEPDGGGYDLAG